MERVELEQWKGREVARLLALVESERRYYQEIVASLPVGLLVIAPDLSIASSNRAARRILGTRTSDLLRGPVDTLLPAPLLEKIKTVFKGFERIDNVTVEHDNRRLRVSILPLRNGDEDNQFEALVSIEDLTGTPAAATAEKAPPPPAPEPPAVEVPAPPKPIVPEKTVVAPAPAPSSTEPAGAEAVELLQSLDAIIWAVDVPSMNFLFVTNTAEDVLGYNPDHWLSTPTFWYDRIHPDDRDAAIKSYQEAIDDGQRHSCEFRSLAAGGRIVWLRV